MPLGPTRVFDNLYYVGSRSLSAWAITTSRGIILIDALRNPDEARSVIEPSMRSRGLDPAQIRYIVVTHGHGDHYGGVRYLVERYRPRVVMSEIDWGEVAKAVLQLDAPQWGRPPERDIAVRDSHRLRLGDTTVELPVAGTDTPETISPIFTVRDGRRRHKVLLWGGTGFNFGPSVERLVSYVPPPTGSRRSPAGATSTCSFPTTRTAMHLSSGWRRCVSASRALPTRS